MRQTLIEAYLDYRNNYLSIELFAEHNGLTVEQTKKFLELAREVFNTPHPDY